MPTSATKADERVSVEAYLAAEQDAEERSELVNGHITAMTGGTYGHNLIKANLTAGLHTRFKGGECTVTSSDTRVKVRESNSFFYPDVVVVCGKPEIEEPNNLLNPKLIIEVLSDSTEARDRGEKFGHYRKIPTLEEVLLVSQHQPKIERYAKKGDGFWLLSEVEGRDAVLALDALPVTLPLAEVYLNVDFVG